MLSQVAEPKLGDSTPYARFLSNTCSSSNRLGALEHACQAGVVTTNKQGGSNESSLSPKPPKAYLSHLEIGHTRKNGQFSSQDLLMKDEGC